MHHFENFKGFATAKLDLSKPMTILIGSNGSGKSNIIEAIQLLSFIAEGGSLYEVTDIGRGSYGLQVRGSLFACSRYGQDTFSLNFSGELMNKLFSYTVAVQTEPTPSISRENLVYDDQMIFETTSNKTSSNNILVRYENFTQESKQPLIEMSAYQSVLSQYSELNVPHKERDNYLKLITNIQHLLHAPFVFEPIPKFMRQYERVGHCMLAKDGANLSAVLYTLAHGNPAEQQILERLLNWIKQLSDKSYQAFDFDITKYHNVMFGLKEVHQTVAANLLSDGTLRHLAILTALETIQPTSLVIIEEFDNGLHPSRVKMLVNAIFDCCQRRNLKVLVTTHNPATLNVLQRPIEQLEHLVLCTWDETEQTSKLTQFFELPYFETLLERGQLGDLVTQRLHEQYLVPHFEEKRQQEVLEWLKNLP